MKQTTIFTRTRTPGVYLLHGFFVLLIVGFALHFEAAVPAHAELDPSLQELNQQLSDKRRAIQELEAQQDVYQKTIDAKQREQQSLSTDIDVLEADIASTQLEVQKTNLEIDSTKLEIEKVQSEIRKLADEILTNKEQLTQFLQMAYRNSKKTYLEIALLNSSFSDFVRDAKYSESVQAELKKSLERVKTLKTEQEDKQNTLNASKEQLEAQKQQLTAQQNALDDQQSYKQQLLDQSQVTEDQYQQLLEQLQQEQNKVNSDIFTIENRVRQKLQDSGEDPLQALGEPIFSWPVAPLRGISAYFHDPRYPFKNLFQHPAIDIPVPHGTQLAAAADGVVAIARGLNWTTIRGVRVPAYNYITILHGDGFSTVYGHVSRIDVTEGQYVTKGQVIGATGGTPGTAGAGTLTTGAHLHFEVRINGIPDDPLKYLP